MRNLLQSIEDKLRYLLEEKLDRLIFPGASNSLNSTLLKLIEKEIEAQQGQCELCLPDLITLRVSPERWDAWQESLPLLDNVSETLKESWEEQGYPVDKKPVIQLLQSADLSNTEIKVETDYAIEENTSRQTAMQKVVHTSNGEAIPKEACLILTDEETFYLNKPIINLGRHSNNDIVLRDPMVSRHHLQLRADKGRYIIFDLGSRGGTSVNGFPANKVALKPGDVLQLGMTKLIYNQHLEQSSSKPTRIIVENAEEKENEA